MRKSYSIDKVVENAAGIEKLFKKPGEHKFSNIKITKEHEFNVLEPVNFNEKEKSKHFISVVLQEASKNKPKRIWIRRRRLWKALIKKQKSETQLSKGISKNILPILKENEKEKSMRFISVVLLEALAKNKPKGIWICKRPWKALNKKLKKSETQLSKGIVKILPILKEEKECAVTYDDRKEVFEVIKSWFSSSYHEAKNQLPLSLLRLMTLDKGIKYKCSKNIADNESFFVVSQRPIDTIEAFTMLHEIFKIKTCDVQKNKSGNRCVIKVSLKVIGHKSKPFINCANLYNSYCRARANNGTGGNEINMLLKLFNRSQICLNNTTFTCIDDTDRFSLSFKEVGNSKLIEIKSNWEPEE